MIVRCLDDILGSEREVRGETGTWASRRLLLKSDNMGFSFSDTVIFAGTRTRLWYKNHLEAVYCISGEGRITEQDNGKVHEIRPGVIYALDKHDRHLLEADSDLRLVCVFNPPLTGREDHDADGSYSLSED